MNNSKILLFIPAYNCEKQISRVLAKITPEIKEYITEILVVDNRSTDATVSVAEAALQALGCTATLIQNDANYNFGGSNKVAIDYSRSKDFDYIILLHGDDQADIRDLLPLMKAGQFKNTDLLLGARFHPRSTLVGYSKFRIVGNIFLNILVSIIYRRKIWDSSAGLNMYHTSIFADNAYQNFPNNLNFSVFTLLHSLIQKKNIVFFPVSWREEDQVSNAKVFQQFFEIIKSIIGFALSGKEKIESGDRPNISRTYTVIFQQNCAS
jgi:glycosyltransferase involved in cell wall biosynthesis